MELDIVLRGREMTKKLRAKILFLLCIFAGFILGGSVILCSFFIPAYYEYLEERKIIQAYSDIGELDLAALEEMDYALFLNYENENLSFYIADEDMTPIYSTSDSENAIHRNIVTKLEKFSRNPEVLSNKGKIIDSVKLRGIITQDGKDYYVAIKDFTVGEQSITLVKNFYAVVFLLMLIPGSILMFFLLRYLLKPVDKLLRVTDQMADGNFEEKAQENGAYAEFNRLAENINRMSEQLQEQMEEMEENRQLRLQQNVRQERMEKLRKDLLANISHELKTPLAVISNQAEMLEYVKEDPGEYISSIQEEVARMSNMVSRILDSSVMENQMQNVVQKKLDMKEVMEYIVMKYEGLAKKKKLRMEAFLSEDCYVYGDREYIEQAANNYMMNALEHTDVGGNIRITLKRQEESIRVGVYNEGRQIPQEELEHIWNSYYRNGTEPKYERGGFPHAGLGLYIVQNVVTMHGGAYGVENVSSGVEFWFTLPGSKTNA